MSTTTALSAAGFAGAPESVRLPRGGSISARADASGVLLVVHDRPDLAVQIRLDADSSIAAGWLPQLQVVDELAGGILILEDAYASQPGGLSFCQAGEERFLRVLDLRPPGKERLRLRASSCIQSLELDEPGIVWRAGEKTLAIHWISGPGHTYAEYRLGKDGAAKLVKRN